MKLGDRRRVGRVSTLDIVGVANRLPGRHATRFGKPQRAYSLALGVAKVQQTSVLCDVAIAEVCQSQFHRRPAARFERHLEQRLHRFGQLGPRPTRRLDPIDPHGRCVGLRCFIAIGRLGCLAPGPESYEDEWQGGWRRKAQTGSSHVGLLDRVRVIETRSPPER